MEHFADTGLKPLNIFAKYFTLNVLQGPKSTPRVFHVETTWKRPFLRRFNVEYTWCVCKGHWIHLSGQSIKTIFSGCYVRFL